MKIPHPNTSYDHMVVDGCFYSLLSIVITILLYAALPEHYFSGMKGLIV